MGMNNVTKESAIGIIKGFLKGAKLAKFEESVRIWDASVAQGSWTKRGYATANSAFYAGLLTLAQVRKLSGWLPYPCEQEMCIRYGSGYTGDFSNVRGVESVRGLTLEIMQAWAFLCELKSNEFHALNNARPRPVVTPIGASPRVTATLKECNLDVDLGTIKPAEIESFETQARNKKGELVFDKNGAPVMTTAYRVKWSKGINLNVSRFGGACHCEVCGKFIPSRTFVAMEMTDRKAGHERLIGMWVGRDCAKTLLGVDDVGVEREAVETAGA